MDIKPPNIQIPNISSSNLKPAINQWRAGQILEATVSSPPKADVLTLKIGGETLQASGKPPPHLLPNLTPGAKLQLQILQTTPQLTLKVLSNSHTPSQTQDALKQFLPKQSSLTPLLANLSALAQSASKSPMPQNLSADIKHLLKQLPSVQQLIKGDTASLKQAIKESGIFFEKNLLQSSGQAETSKNMLNRDFKANMLKVLAQLQNQQQTNTLPEKQAKDSKSSQHVQTITQPRPPSTTPSSLVTNSPIAASSQKPITSTATTTTPPPPSQPPPPLKNTPVQAQGRSQPTLSQSSPLAMVINELTQQIEGALSRIRVNQLANVPVDASQPQNWGVELPIRRGEFIDLFHIHVEEDKQSHPDDETTKDTAWKLTMAFDLEELGPMYATITLHAKKIAATLHAEKPSTAKLIDNNLSELSQSFTDAGLTIEKLVCHQGKPVQASRTRLSQSLLDIKV